MKTARKIIEVALTGRYRLFGYGILILVFGVLVGCHHQENIPPDSVVLARVGDKIITKTDLKTRAEFSIRPQFRGVSRDAEKRIILNSLIAEKLLALEGEKNRKLANQEAFQLRIQGIKEQWMRDALFQEVAAKPVRLDTSEIRKEFKLAGRKYDLAYYILYKKSIATDLSHRLSIEPDAFEAVFQEHNNGKHPLSSIPRKIVTYQVDNPDTLHTALFSHEHKVGDVIGPLHLPDGSYIVMKVMNWQLTPAVSGLEVQKRWKKVREKMTQKKARANWRNFKANLLIGKSIDFDNKSFYYLADKYYDLKLGQQRKQDASLRADSTNTVSSEVLSVNADVEPNMLDDQVLTVDGEQWTIGQFQKMLRRHPLVFPGKIARREDFYRQFRTAIIDLVADSYLTDKAYEMNLDRNRDVQHIGNLWEDYYQASYTGQQYAKVGTDTSDNTTGRLKTHLDSLIQAYDSKIVVYLDVLRDIKLTNINMVALVPHTPFPNVVPSLPRFLYDDTFNYTHLISSEK